MKVVINVCFGGFGLSDSAAEECIRRGMTVTQYTPAGEYKNEADFVDYTTAPGPHLSSTGKYWVCNRNDLSFRSNPIVVAVVEEMGSQKSSGRFAKLKVIEIPFDSTDGWEIDEYDGSESIRETHRSWS